MGKTHDFPFFPPKKHDNLDGHQPRYVMPLCLNRASNLERQMKATACSAMPMTIVAAECAWHRAAPTVEHRKWHTLLILLMFFDISVIGWPLYFVDPFFHEIKQRLKPLDSFEFWYLKI